MSRSDFPTRISEKASFRRMIHKAKAKKTKLKMREHGNYHRGIMKVNKHKATDDP